MSLKFTSVGTLSPHFTGEAANDEYLWPHLVLLANMEDDIPVVMEHFANDMVGIFKQMNLDAALARQYGVVDDGPLDSDIPIIPKTELQIWSPLPLPIWKVVIESYQDHMWEHDNKKFRTLYATVGTEALNYFLNTGKHKDEDAVRCVFENSYKDEMRMLRLLTDMLSHHLPQVIVNTSIYSMMNSPHVTPLITLTAKSGYDLRDILRQYVDRQSTPALRPT